MILPLHALPSAMNETRSYRDAVVVIVGVVEPAHLTLVNVAVKPPAPVITLRMNDFPAVAVGIVNVQFPVSVTV